MKRPIVALLINRLQDRPRSRFNLIAIIERAREGIAVPSFSSREEDLPLLPPLLLTHAGLINRRTNEQQQTLFPCRRIVIRTHRKNNLITRSEKRSNRLLPFFFFFFFLHESELSKEKKKEKERNLYAIFEHIYSPRDFRLEDKHGRILLLQIETHSIPLTHNNLLTIRERANRRKQLKRKKETFTSDAFAEYGTRRRHRIK